MLINKCGSFKELEEQVEATLISLPSWSSVFARFRLLDKMVEIQWVTDFELCLLSECESCQTCCKGDWLRGNRHSTQFLKVRMTSWNNLVKDLNKMFDLNHNIGQQPVFARFQRKGSGQFTIEMIMGSDLCTGCTDRTGCTGSDLCNDYTFLDCAWRIKFDWLQGLDVSCD